MSDLRLKDVVNLQQSSIRSIRLEEDFFNRHLVEKYVPTAQALYTLERIFNGIEQDRGRAWTITGPYGSGKSFFGLFLSHTLDGLANGNLAREKLRQNHPDLAERIQRWTTERGGLITIPVTGARVSLQTSLIRAFEKTLSQIENPVAEKFIQTLEQLKNTDSRAFINWLRDFIAVVCPHQDSRGLLLIFDELGKALEHAAAHPLENDIYLLQELAEFANRSGETPFVFVGILHQAFEQYATLLDHITQREWAKIQGRFEDVPLLEPPAQQMRLLAQAFEGNVPNLPETFSDLHYWQPDMLSSTEFAALCRRVYPLHPSVFVALPYVFRRLGQNERSLFTYLTSFEPYGFQDFIATHSVGDYLRLPDLFDYLAANYEGRLYTSGRARPLTEVIERLAHTTNLTLQEQSLLKAIAILNWLSENSPLQANEARILKALAETPAEEASLRSALGHLRELSLIAYRSFNQTYVVWQGSDVDLEERLQAAYASLPSTFSLADVLETNLPARPLIARRHSYKTGALRFFNVRYVDRLNFDKVSLEPTDGASGVVLLCLPTTLMEVELFRQWAQSPPISTQKNLVVGVANRAMRLKEYVQELRGLHWVQKNTPEMRGDRVAEREWRARLAMMEAFIHHELQKSLNIYQSASQTDCQWYYGGQDVSNRVRRSLTSLLSEICDSLYESSPRIWNEILNRRVLSTQGAAARRNLIEGILNRSDQPLLGIQKYPPERSMYEALLREGEMHRVDGEKWYLSPPAANERNLLPAWQAIYVFVFGGLPEPRPILQLYNNLSQPPFGVLMGIIPVLLAIFYKCFENEVTLYKEGTLIVEPGIADWEVLLRRPELFSIAGCRVSGLRAAIVERMARGLGVPPYVMPVVRAIIGRLKALPEYAWHTRQLPAVSLRVRRAVEMTRSPERFLFVELPEALELPPFEESEFDQQRFETFFQSLNAALDALATATPRLIHWARSVWLTACGLPADESGWELFLRQSEILAPRVTQPQLMPLLKRAAQATDSRAALESVLAYIANRPVRTWSDLDAERYEAQARYLGSLFREENGMNPPLSPEVQDRAQELANRLKTILLQSGETDETIEYALRQLLIQMKARK